MGEAIIKAMPSHNSVSPLPRDRVNCPGPVVPGRAAGSSGPRFALYAFALVSGVWLSGKGRG